MPNAGREIWNLFYVREKSEYLKVFVGTFLCMIVMKKEILCSVSGVSYFRVGMGKRTQKWGK